MTARRAAAMAVAASLLASCGGTGQPYFGDPDRTGVSAPARTAQTVYFGVAWLVANDGDDVRILSADAVDPRSETGTLTWHVLPLPQPGAEAGIGAVAATDPLVDALTELAGARVATGPREYPTAGTQVVAGMRGDAPGVISFRAVRLRFMVNGQERTQDFPMAVALCVDDPAPSECSPPDA